MDHATTVCARKIFVPWAFTLVRGKFLDYAVVTHICQKESLAVVCP